MPKSTKSTKRYQNPEVVVLMERIQKLTTTSDYIRTLPSPRKVSKLMKEHDIPENLHDGLYYEPVGLIFKTCKPTLTDSFIQPLVLFFGKYTMNSLSVYSLILHTLETSRNTRNYTQLVDYANYLSSIFKFALFEKQDEERYTQDELYDILLEFKYIVEYTATATGLSCHRGLVAVFKLMINELIESDERANKLMEGLVPKTQNEYEYYQAPTNNP